MFFTALRNRTRSLWFSTLVLGLGLVLIWLQLPTSSVSATPDDVEQLTSTQFIRQFKATIGGADSRTFIPLTDPTIRMHFESLLDALLANNLPAAQREIAALDALGVRYKLVRIDDVANGPALGFMERVPPGVPDYHGWGAVLVRPSAAGARIYQAPHVKADAFSEDIALQAFIDDPDAPVLLFAGTHRYAGVSYSWVSGTYEGTRGPTADWLTGEGKAPEEPEIEEGNWVYPEPVTEDELSEGEVSRPWTGIDENRVYDDRSASDVAHNPDNLFHALTVYLARRGQTAGKPYWFIQVHGSRDRNSEPSVVGSNGADNPRLTADSPLVRLDTLVDGAGYVDMGVCGWVEGPGDDEDGDYRLCATTNIQGDFLESLSLRDTFVHLELERHVRNDYRAGQGPGYVGVLNLLADIRMIF